MQGMGYGGMRGQYQQPQPQRNGNRRNRYRGGGTRFDGGARPNYQQPRANKEIKPDVPPAEKPTPLKPVVKEQQQTPTQAPAVNKTTTPVQQQPAKPAPAASTPPNTNQQNQNNQNKPQNQQAQNKPQNQQIQNKPQNQQIQNKPQNQQTQNKPQNQQIQNKPQNLQNQNKPQNLANQNKPQNQPQNQQKSAPASANTSLNTSSGGNQNKGNAPNSGPKPLPLSLNQNPPPFNLNKGGNQGPGGNNGPNNRGTIRRHMGTEKGGPGGSRDEHFMMSKLKEISGSTIDIQPIDQLELKFSGRNRLYIGNLTNDITEQEILDIFQAYGETAELFVNKEKNFAFIRIDYKANAEKAKREVDGRMRRGRPLRVRFAPHNAAIRVKNLTPFVSNELLYKSFEIFGKIERAVVKVDERGKSLGEGLVEYARKAGAMAAIRNCSERCYFLTASLRPVVVESYEEVDEADGYTEKTLPRKNQDFIRAREVGPRFAEPGSFEHEYGTRWKQLHELFKQKEDALKREIHMEEEKLEAQMEYAKYEHETELLRDQLRQREQDRERQKRSWEMAERQADEQREKERESVLLQQEDMAQRMRHQEDELRRRQKENTLFMQAQQLNRILDVQEQGMSGGRGYDNNMQDGKRNFDGPMSGMGNMSGMGGNNMDSQYMEHYDQMRGGHMGYEDSMGRWDSRQEDYPNKRRRY